VAGLKSVVFESRIKDSSSLNQLPYWQVMIQVISKKTTGAKVHPWQDFILEWRKYYSTLANMVYSCTIFSALTEVLFAKKHNPFQKK